MKRFPWKLLTPSSFLLLVAMASNLLAASDGLHRIGQGHRVLFVTRSVRMGLLPYAGAGRCWQRGCNGETVGNAACHYDQTRAVPVSCPRSTRRWLRSATKVCSTQSNRSLMSIPSACRWLIDQRLEDQIYDNICACL